MGAFSPTTGSHHIHQVHRIAAGVAGGLLLLLGALGAAWPAASVAASGPVVAGLLGNVALVVVSSVLGSSLLFGALRSGPAASTVTVASGAVLLGGGIVDVLLPVSTTSELAAGMTTVVFGLLAGSALLTLGSYGRFTGSLPADSPYSRPRTPAAVVPRLFTDGSFERALAAAERAVALRCATVEQALGVRAAAQHRVHEQRLAAFVGALRLQT